MEGDPCRGLCHSRPYLTPESTSRVVAGSREVREAWQSGEAGRARQGDRQSDDTPRAEVGDDRMSPPSDARGLASRSYSSRGCLLDMRRTARAYLPERANVSPRHAQQQLAGWDCVQIRAQREPRPPERSRGPSAKLTVRRAAPISLASRSRFRQEKGGRLF